MKRLAAKFTTMLQHILRSWFRHFWQKTSLLWFASCLISWYGFLRLLIVSQTQEAIKRKSDESTKHYHTQILLAINRRYWLAGKNHTYVWRFEVALCKRASLKSIRFSQKKKKVGYNRGLYVCTYLNCVIVMSYMKTAILNYMWFSKYGSLFYS